MVVPHVHQEHVIGICCAIRVVGAFDYLDNLVNKFNPDKNKLPILETKYFPTGYGLLIALPLRQKCSDLGVRGCPVRVWVIKMIFFRLWFLPSRFPDIFWGVSNC